MKACGSADSKQAVHGARRPGVATRWRTLIHTGLLLLGALVSLPYAHAQQSGATVRVGTFLIAPFVMQQNGQLTGFSIDLWTEIAARLHLQTRYDIAPSVNALFQTLRTGQDDVAVSGLFYSVERDREFDFSYPIMEAGLRVMVRDTGETEEVTPLRSLGALLVSRTTLLWFAAAVALTAIAAHAVWIVDYLHARRRGEREPYFPAIFRALYWSGSTLLTQADEPRRLWISRGMALIWMFVGIVFVASYTAELTTNLTVQHIRGAIDGPNDLANKTVATLGGSSAVPWLQDHGAQVREYVRNRDIFLALANGDVDAVVLGSAGLGYVASHEGKGRVKLVGPEFNPNDVGFVFPVNSALRRRVDGALLAMREDGTYQRIYDKWFGEE
ncbi:transporter substrate-binding domain-containing protein [Paraburkholderia sp. J12]|uniref:transporter substrate-binding domain-containing protein n=1 Tax=Paraburkholderia sp. J12 TaxID=2805432 RepID=UPI002ABD18D8|nr:transporter substrate-binding domain-containing protein [Paraburkholderia sp. J12]